jgi:hypothetical protein
MSAVKKGAEGVIALPSTLTKAEEARLRAAGWAPVVRWVHVASRSDVAFKGIEALTRLMRQDESTGKKVTR